MQVAGTILLLYTSESRRQRSSEKTRQYVLFHELLANSPHENSGSDDLAHLLQRHDGTCQVPALRRLSWACDSLRNLDEI